MKYYKTFCIRILVKYSTNTVFFYLLSMVLLLKCQYCVIASKVSASH